LTEAIAYYQTASKAFKPARWHEPAYRSLKRADLSFAQTFRYLHKLTNAVQAAP